MSGSRSYRDGKLLDAVKRPAHERRNLPAVHIFIGRFAGGVVPAGQNKNFVVQAMPLKLVHGIARELGKEGQVVVGINNERLLGPARKLIEIGHGAYRAPELAQAVEIDFGLDAFADVTRGLTVPDYVGYI